MHFKVKNTIALSRIPTSLLVSEALSRLPSFWDLVRLQSDVGIWQRVLCSTDQLTLFANSPTKNSVCAPPGVTAMIQFLFRLISSNGTMSYLINLRTYRIVFRVQKEHWNFDLIYEVYTGNEVVIFLVNFVLWMDDKCEFFIKFECIFKLFYLV